MKFPYERRSTRLGPSTWRRIAKSTLRTADDAYLSVICNGGWAGQSETEGLTCSGPPISTGFPRTNGKADRATDRTDNSGKREAGLDVARPFVPCFSDAGLGDAIHR
jgi:hypothetical protein